MEWFNVFGLFFVMVIRVPNIIFAIKCKDGYVSKWEKKFEWTDIKLVYFNN